MSEKSIVWAGEEVHCGYCHVRHFEGVIHDICCDWKSYKCSDCGIAFQMCKNCQDNFSQAEYPLCGGCLGKRIS